MSLLIEKLTIRLGRNTILQELSWTLPRRGVVGLIGPNGAGKSTLLDAISGFLPLQKGSIRWEGRPASRRRLISLAARLHQVDVIADVTGVELLAVARCPAMFVRYWRHHHALGGCRDQSVKEVEAFAHRAGLEVDFHQKHLVSMSGGQRRVTGALATIGTGKPLILLDEPFAGLAEATAAHLIRQLRRIARDRLIIVVEHDVRRLATIADTIVVMRSGKIVGVFPGGTSRATLLKFFYE